MGRRRKRTAPPTDTSSPCKASGKVSRRIATRKLPAVQIETTSKTTFRDNAVYREKFHTQSRDIRAFCLAFRTEMQRFGDDAPTLHAAICPHNEVTESTLRKWAKGTLAPRFGRTTANIRTCLTGRFRKSTMGLGRGVRRHLCLTFPTFPPLLALCDPWSYTRCRPGRAWPMTLMRVGLARSKTAWDLPLSKVVSSGRCCCTAICKKLATVNQHRFNKVTVIDPISFQRY
jgi:hypothetical protein